MIHEDEARKQDDEDKQEDLELEDEDAEDVGGGAWKIQQTPDVNEKL